MYLHNVYICSYLFVGACIACICMYLCWHLQTNMYVYVYVYMKMNPSISTGMIYIYICMYLYVLVCICLYMYVFACMFLHAVLVVVQGFTKTPVLLEVPWGKFQSKRRLNKTPLTKLEFKHLSSESSESNLLLSHIGFMKK